MNKVMFLLNVHYYIHDSSNDYFHSLQTSYRIYFIFSITSEKFYTHMCVPYMPPPNRESFVVPDSVPWPSVSEALNCFFHTHTQRGLTPQNLDYLGRKLLGAGQ